MTQQYVKLVTEETLQSVMTDLREGFKQVVDKINEFDNRLSKIEIKIDKFDNRIISMENKVERLGFPMMVHVPKEVMDLIEDYGRNIDAIKKAINWES